MNNQTQNNARGAPKGKLAIGVTVIAAIGLMLSETLDLEGGYVNHPSDPGGETNHGITVGTARQAGFNGSMRDLKRTCDYPIEMRASLERVLDEGDGELRAKLLEDSDGEEKCAEQILYEGYIEKPGYLPLIVIDWAVASEVFDQAVNFGPSRPSRYFQRAVNRLCGTNLGVDGRIGPLTVDAWARCRESRGPRVCVQMLDDLDRQQEAEYRRLARRAWARKFLRGWLNHRIGNVPRSRCGTLPPVQGTA
ncbi:MAG: glycosyl hydrolase 108 family protein [Pseudomonadota bacterium]